MRCFAPDLGQSPYHYDKGLTMSNVALIAADTSVPFRNTFVYHTETFTFNKDAKDQGKDIGS